MTTRYQSEHYEDVARILQQHVHLPRHIEQRQLVEDFADLFAADNPPRCSTCGASVCSQRGHVFVSGFNCEQFLADCGLRSLDVDAKPRRLEKTHDEIDPTGYGAALRRLRRG